MTLTLIKTLQFDCVDCGGSGYLYWGNAEDYDVETCDCVKENK